MTQTDTSNVRRLALRYGLTAGGVVAVAGTLAFAAFSLGGERTDRPGGPLMAISLVAPTEPEVDPGSTMEVGQLNDGFDRAALERRPDLEDDAYLPPDAYVGEVWVERMPMPTPVDIGSPMEAYRAVVDRGSVRDALNDGSRNFGFDAPRRDFAAEREARWAAREAAVAAQAGPQDGAVPYSEAVKYSSE